MKIFIVLQRVENSVMPIFKSTEKYNLQFLYKKEIEDWLHIMLDTFEKSTNFKSKCEYSLRIERTEI